MVIKKSVALGCIGKMHIVALKVPFHKANERGFRHPESKNRSMVKARFRHPTIDPGTLVYTDEYSIYARLSTFLYRTLLLSHFETSV